MPSSVYYSSEPTERPVYVYPDNAPPRRDDSGYRWVTGIGGLVQYGIFLGFVLLIARGLPWRDAFALRRPTSWPRAIGLVVAVLFATYIAMAVVAAALNPEPDQGIPEFWDGSRAAQFALTFAVAVLVAPVVEELMFRGLGFGLLSRFGPRTALVVTALAFGLYHGFLVALPLFVIAGLALGWVRMRTGSVYPGKTASRTTWLPS